MQLAAASVPRSAQDVGEQVLWDCDLGHLEDDIAPVADNLRADLDRLLFQAREQPVFDRLRRRQCAREIAEIVGQRVKLKANGVGSEGAT
jgi:hypothetical protein